MCARQGIRSKYQRHRRRGVVPGKRGMEEGWRGWGWEGGGFPAIIPHVYYYDIDYSIVKLVCLAGVDFTLF